MLNLNLPFRIIQTLLAIITLGLNAYIVSWYMSHTKSHTSPRQAPFLVFVSSWTLLTLPYLYMNPALAHTHKNKTGGNGRFFNKFAVLTLDAVTMALWFAGFIALACFKGGLIICVGHVCTFMFASVVVGALAWFFFLITTVFASLHVIRTRRGDEVANELTHSGWVGKEPSVTTTEV